MRFVTATSILAVLLVVISVASGVVGSYPGAVTALTGLSVLLIARLIANGREVPIWSTRVLEVNARVPRGQLARTATTIRNAAKGDRYSRTELVRLLLFLKASRNEGPDSSDWKETASLRRPIFTSKDGDEMGEEERFFPILHGLTGKAYRARLEREVESMDVE